MEDKRVAVELWKAGVPLKNIREQLKMSERSLGRILAHDKSNPSVDPPDGQHGLPQDPGGVHAKEAVIENGGNATKY